MLNDDLERLRFLFSKPYRIDDEERRFLEVSKRLHHGDTLGMLAQLFVAHNLEYGNSTDGTKYSWTSIQLPATLEDFTIWMPEQYKLSCYGFTKDTPPKANRDCDIDVFVKVDFLGQSMNLHVVKAHAEDVCVS